MAAAGSMGIEFGNDFGFYLLGWNGSDANVITAMLSLFAKEEGPELL